MTKLVAALFQLAVFGQDTMHGAHRAEVGTFVQKGGIDLDRSLVPEAFRVQLIEYRLPFLRIERARWRQPDPVHGGRLQATVQPVSYTHLRAHETVLDLVCRLLLEKKK